MRRATLISLGVAALLTVAAVLIGRSWLAGQAEQARAPGMTTLVVAARELKFGDAIGPADVRTVRWPSESVPAGAIATLAELALERNQRQALDTIPSNTPITSSNVTGPEQRAILSAIVTPGMRAFALRVDDVVGVGGFVLPNDRVDVILVRADEGRIGAEAFRADLLLQNLRVLGVDQDSTGNGETAVVAEAVTVEVTAEQAQMLSLASQSGSLRLALRNQASTDNDPSRTITLRDLRSADGAVRETANTPPRPQPVRRRAAAPSGEPVVVTRGQERAVVQVAAEPTQR